MPNVIRLLVLDVDGVLTDGRLYFGPRGEAMKAFNVRDGFGLVQVMRAAALSFAVADAHREVRRAADVVTRLPGGRGAVREVCDHLLALRARKVRAR